MSDLRGRDPRGRTVVLQGKTWVIHIAPKHGEELGGKVLEVFKTMTDPDMILDNPSTTVARDRVASERYVRYAAPLAAHIVVPALELEEALVTKGAGTAPAGSMRAITAHLSSDAPRGRVLWTKTSG